MPQQRIRNMTTGGPLRLLITFALPLMAGNIFQQLYTIVDTVVVGQVLGVGALASVGAADWLNWLTIGIVQGFAHGFSILISQYFGAGDHKEMNRAIGASVTLCAVFSVALLIISHIFLIPVLGILNTPSEVLPGAVIYLRVIFSGLPAVIAYNLLSSVLRALGDSKTPLYAMIVASITNVGLDLLFVMVFGWGIGGAAIATVLAQVLSSVYCFMMIRKIQIIKIKGSYLKPAKKLVFNLLKLGSPIALQNGIIGVGGIVVQSVINSYGMLFIAGFTATNKLYGLLEIAATSYGYAVTSYVGQNIGAGKVKRIKQGMRAAALVALATSAVIAVLMIVFGKLFLGMFISGSPGDVATSMNIAYRYLFIMSVFLPILYMLHIYRSALMGLGNTVVPMISGFSEMALRIGVVMILPLFIGQSGIFYAEIAAWTAAAIILVFAYYIQIRNYKESPLSSVDSEAKLREEGLT